MIDIQDMPSRAEDLHRRPDIVQNPKTPKRLSRMAEAYVHIMKTDTRCSAGSWYCEFAVIQAKAGRQREGTQYPVAA